MKTMKLVIIGSLIFLAGAVPAVAYAHGSFGGGVILGFGTGLLAGFLLSPGPVYVAPPAYAVPPPPAVYRSYPYYVPAPVPPTTYGYSNNASVSPAIPPRAGQSKCREWRLINRHWQNRWDPYSGRWRTVLVERWGWAGVPCAN
jgi:hypothetical protein